VRERPAPPTDHRQGVERQVIRHRLPIDFTTLRDEVGDDVESRAGCRWPNCTGTQAQVFARAEAILKSGILRGGRFILKEANNLPPQTPLENIEAMYAAARAFGRYIEPDP